MSSHAVKSGAYSSVAGIFKGSTIPRVHCAFACSLFVIVFSVAPTMGQTFDWREPHCRVVDTGDLEWTPEPFKFVTGESVRYIDFDDGDDFGSGTKTQPWKHHPWDKEAQGRAATASGVHTYVFKRGVVYRGALRPDESGKADDPIRLTSDPLWGRGNAVISGSEWVRGWKRGAEHNDIPESDMVWHVDIPWAPRNVWLVDSADQITRVPLARTPNWVVSDPNDVKSSWWQFDNPRKAWSNRKTVAGVEMHLAFDTKNLTGPREFYEGALVWPEYGWVMSTPYPTKVREFDPDTRGLVFGGQWGRNAGSYHIGRYCRYYLEDKPHYLDDFENGEFWFHKKGAGGRLYIRLPHDADPNATRVEVARRMNLIDGEAFSHVHVSGLSFRFTNAFWDLTAPPFQVTGNPLHKDVNPACIRLLGSGRNLVVGNCRFEHVHMPVRLVALGESVLDNVTIRDNTMAFTDHGAVELLDDGEWGVEYPKGRLYDVQVLRNNLSEIGRRPNRFGQGQAINIAHAQTANIAGNVLHRVYAGGIFVRGAKTSHGKVDRPLTRIMIHHNKVVEPLVMTNDFGGIETWQGGPAYVFNNIVGNPGGYKHWGIQNQPDRPAAARFGHAYYMDGGFKQYYFNNIAWGQSKDPRSPLGNTSAFQEIHGYLATIFNNTVYNFVNGSRRQAPVAGRNKYMGNIWHSIGYMVFRHSEPAKTMADPNAADAGRQKSDFEHETNVYAANVFFETPEIVAVFEPSGRWHTSVDGFRRALHDRGSIGELGELSQKSPLRDPAGHDFRPTAAAADRGVKVFVPWGLCANVAEWHFYHAGNDETSLPDEHWYMAPHFVDRTTYHKEPRYPLRTVNMDATSFSHGPLEDWTAGALRFNGQDQYAVCTHATLQPAPADSDLSDPPKSADVRESNFLVEAWFRTDRDHHGGVIIQKQNASGYALTINDDGGVTFTVKVDGLRKALASHKPVNDGRWHHVIAEADRVDETLSLYVDGTFDAKGSGVDTVSLTNTADLYVGGTPDGDCLAGEIDFMRVSLGTLADAKTSIEELYAWQFDGPFLRDFTSRAAIGEKRDAGAIEGP